MHFPHEHWVKHLLWKQAQVCGHTRGCCRWCWGKAWPSLSTASHALPRAGTAHSSWIRSRRDGMIPVHQSQKGPRRRAGTFRGGATSCFPRSFHAVLNTQETSGKTSLNLPSPDLLEQSALYQVRVRVLQSPLPRAVEEAGRQRQAAPRSGAPRPNHLAFISLEQSSGSGAWEGELGSGTAIPQSQARSAPRPRVPHQCVAIPPQSDGWPPHRLNPQSSGSLLTLHPEQATLPCRPSAIQQACDRDTLKGHLPGHTKQGAVSTGQTVTWTSSKCCSTDGCGDHSPRTDT